MNDENNISDYLKDSPEKQFRSLNPFTLPEDYFSGFNWNLMDKISDEGHIPDILQEISKRTPYSLPDGYFDDAGLKIQASISPKSERPVRSLKHSWRHLAAAAATLGIIVLAAVLFYSYHNKAGDFALQKIENVSTERLNGFLGNPDSVQNSQPILSITKSDAKPVDFDQLFKKISDRDLKSFLDETGSNDDDFLMN